MVIFTKGNKSYPTHIAISLWLDEVNLMKSSYVSQCSCCDKRFMRIELEQRIPEYLERDFVELLGSDVDDIFLSKQFYFTLEGGYIVSF